MWIWKVHSSEILRGLSVPVLSESFHSSAIDSLEITDVTLLTHWLWSIINPIIESRIAHQLGGSFPYQTYEFENQSPNWHMEWLTCKFCMPLAKRHPSAFWQIWHGHHWGRIWVSLKLSKRSLLMTLRDRKGFLLFLIHVQIDAPSL